MTRPDDDKPKDKVIVFGFNGVTNVFEFEHSSFEASCARAREECTKRLGLAFVALRFATGTLYGFHSFVTRRAQPMGPGELSFLLDRVEGLGAEVGEYKLADEAQVRAIA